MNIPRHGQIAPQARRLATQTARAAWNTRVRQPAPPAQAGFTLMEVLVAVVIVGLTVTVFFQLLSGSLRLEARGRETASAVVEARMLFDQLMAMDLRDDGFPWSGEADGRSWSVSMQAVDAPDPLDAAQADRLSVRTPSELYRIELDFTTRGGRAVSLTLYRDFEPGYLTDDFKDEHVSELPEGEAPLEELPASDETDQEEARA